MQPFAAPDGWIWTGTVFARLDPIPGGQNVLTVSQAAYQWGASDPAQYPTVADQPLPVNTPTPTYAMDEFGNIGPITDPHYAYSVQQAQAAAAAANAQLLASGANPYLPPPTVTDASGQTYVYDGASNQPAPVRSSLPPNTPPPVVATAPNEVPSDYLFPVGSENAQTVTTPRFTTTAAPAPAPVPAPAPAPVFPRSSGATAVSFTFTPAAFNDPAAYAYMLRYPDVLAAYRANSYGMTPDVFARTHYERFGVPERRIWSASMTPPAGPTAAPGATPAVLPIAAAIAALFYLG